MHVPLRTRVGFRTRHGGRDTGTVCSRRTSMPTTHSSRLAAWTSTLRSAESASGPPVVRLCDPGGNSSSSSAENDAQKTAFGYAWHQASSSGPMRHLGWQPMSTRRGRTPSRPDRGQTRRRSHQQVDPISPASCSSPVFTTRRSHHNARMLASYMTRPAASREHPHTGSGSNDPLSERLSLPLPPLAMPA